MCGAGAIFEAGWQMKPVDGIKEEEGADAFVEVGALASKMVKFGALLDQFLRRKAGTDGVKRSIAQI